MADRVIAYTLEQATSSDFNVAQVMQTRRLDEMVAKSLAEHQVPVRHDDLLGISSNFDTPKSVIVGLNIFWSGSADFLNVSTGTMTQFGPEWLAATTPASSAVTGHQRVEVNVPYVSTAGLGLANDASDAFHLLCARIVDVTTNVTTVNVFDVPSQTFVPTVIPKWVETRIEYKWVLGGALDSNHTVLPALDSGGEGWEPLAYVSFVYPGGTANNVKIIDVARRISGLTNDFMSPLSSGSPSNAYSLPARSEVSIQSNCIPTAQTGFEFSPGISGCVVGSIEDEKVFFSSSPDLRNLATIDATGGESWALNQLINFYLCPIPSTLVKRWPTLTSAVAVAGAQTGTQYDARAQRGLLVASKARPSHRKTNLDLISLHEVSGIRGKWSNTTDVLPHSALYIGSGHQRSTVIGDLYPMISNGVSTRYATGKSAVLGNYDKYECPEIAQVLAWTGTSSHVKTSTVLDLHAKVPFNAKTVILYFVLTGYTDLSALIIRVTDYLYAEADSKLQGLVLASGELVSPSTSQEFHDDKFPGVVLEVPVGWIPNKQASFPGVLPGDTEFVPPYPPIDDKYYFRVLRAHIHSVASGNVMGAISVRLLGWTT